MFVYVFRFFYKIYCATKKIMYVCANILYAHYEG